MTTSVKKTAAAAVKTAALKSDDDFMKLRDSIHKRADTVQNDIHRYLVGVAAAWLDSGDCRPVAKRVNSLLDGLPKGLRSNAIREWSERFLFLMYCEEGDAKDTFIMLMQDGGTKPVHSAKELKMEELTQKRWFDLKPEPAYKPMDLEASLTKLLADATKRKDSTKGDEIPSDLLTAVSAAVAAWHNTHIDISANVH